MSFTEEQINRYSRHILLPEVGGKGQKKIAQAKVFVVGAGGLGNFLLSLPTDFGQQDVPAVSGDLFFREAHVAC